MAKVELARDTELGRPVAVKRLDLSLAGDEVFRERFVREARLAASLQHPNLVSVYDVGEEDGSPYIVMEYVQGETLADLIARKAPLPPERAVGLLVQICDGLEHAHAAGLVHRDIKPQNLLVRDDGVVKIADFGIARTLDGTQLTQVGTVLGTAAYLAPEQAAGERVTAAADVYALGAVAYELLSGHKPYEVESLAELALKQRQPPPPLPDMPPSVERAVMRSLAFDPADRPRSAGEFARELRQDSATAATEVMQTPRTIRISRTILVAGLALLLAVIGLGIAYFGDDEPAPETPPLETTARPDVLPRGDTPAESARLLSEWLRERSG